MVCYGTALWAGQDTPWNGTLGHGINNVHWLELAGHPEARYGMEQGLVELVRNGMGGKDWFGVAGIKVRWGSHWQGKE